MIPRRAHLKKIYGRRTSDDSLDQSTWIEVLRIDEFESLENHGGQVKIFRLRWNDDEGDEGVDTAGNGLRDMRTVRINKGGDSGVYFEVKAIDRMVTYEGDQRSVRVFKNGASNSARVVQGKRVYHTNATLPNNGTWQEYIDALNAVDAPAENGAYVDVELVGRYFTKEMQGPDYQASAFVLRPNDQIDALQIDTDGEGIARLDPFQMVVNINGEFIYFFDISWEPDDHFLGLVAVEQWKGDSTSGTFNIAEWTEIDTADVENQVFIESDAVTDPPVYEWAWIAGDSGKIKGGKKFALFGFNFYWVVDPAAPPATLSKNINFKVSALKGPFTVSDDKTFYSSKTAIQTVEVTKTVIGTYVSGPFIFCDTLPAFKFTLGSGAFVAFDYAN